MGVDWWKTRHYRFATDNPTLWARRELRPRDRPGRGFIVGAPVMRSRPSPAGRRGVGRVAGALPGAAMRGASRPHGTGSVSMGSQLSLHTETLRQVVTSDPICLDPLAPVREAFERMKEQQRGAVLICREGKLVGIFTERDALALMADAVDLSVPIERVMTPDPVALSEHDTVGAAITRMAQGGYRRLPIVDAEGRPVGFVKVGSILHFLVDHFPATVYNLPPAPHHATEAREGA